MSDEAKDEPGKDAPGKDAPGKVGKKPLRLLRKLRLVVIGSALGLGVGAFAGIVVVRSGFLPDAGLAVGLAILTFVSIHIIERAYNYWRVPRSIGLYSEELREMSFETTRAGIYFAECQMAMASFLDRCPKPYEDVVMLTSQLGYAMHREALTHAENAGLIPKVCWDVRRDAIPLPPSASLVSCTSSEHNGSVSVVDTTGDSVSSMRVPDPPLLPRVASASSASSRPDPPAPSSRVRGGFTIRKGKLVVVK
jgi:hypothetical protein